MTQVAEAVERLRLAEARLSRRRQTACGPSETARAAMRFILEKSDAGIDVTPTALSEHLGISTASVTGMLTNLHAGGMIAYLRNPDDGRSKLIVPLDRSTDPDDLDPIGATIRTLASDIPEGDVELITRFLARVTDAVDRECT